MEEQLTKKELADLKAKELDILVKFDRMCKENNLRYFITAGTLLGAVRHKGFIPWDDDIDVVMLRKDFKKLNGVCKKSITRRTFSAGQEE
ncbi:MAG: LicD family protein [[Eubacterium] siraeum]